MAKILVAYYSRNKQNYVAGALKDLPIGNTEVIAKHIGEKLNADLFKIEQVQPYANDYNQCIEQAKNDKIRDARPCLVNYLANIDDYDVIYLGFPNYWGTMPMAVFTFLEHYNFKGKTIKPFITHEGSGFGNSIEDIKKCCPDTNIKDGLAIYGHQVATSFAKVDKWLD